MEIALRRFYHRSFRPGESRASRNATVSGRLFGLAFSHIRRLKYNAPRVRLSRTRGVRRELLRDRFVATLLGSYDNWNSVERARARADDRAGCPPRQ